MLLRVLLEVSQGIVQDPVPVLWTTWAQPTKGRIATIEERACPAGFVMDLHGVAQQRLQHQRLVSLERCLHSGATEAQPAQRSDTPVGDLRRGATTAPCGRRQAGRESASENTPVPDRVSVPASKAAASAASRSGPHGSDACLPAAQVVAAQSGHRRRACHMPAKPRRLTWDGVVLPHV